MSIFADILAPEKRATFTSNMTGNWLTQLFGEPATGNASGVSVTPDNSWKYTAFYGCVDLISRAIAQLPLQLYRWKKDDVREQARGHRVHNMISRRPNFEQTAYVWRHAMQAWVLTWGNAYAEIQRDGANRPVALWPMHPRHMTVTRDKATKKLIYEYRGAPEVQTLDYMDVLHIRTAGDGLVGLSPVKLFAQSIGLGIAAETAGAALFKNGMRTGGVLQHPGVLKDPAKKNLRASMESKHAGSENTGSTMILEEGMKWIQNTIPPDDAQYIETRVRQLRDITCIFHAPPHKLGDLADATFANCEELNIEWVTDGLSPWFVNWEQEIDFKLLSPSEQSGYFSKFNANALMRGNAAARAGFYSSMFNQGAYSINDILKLEDKNPIGPDGDIRFIPGNMITLDRAIKGPPPQPEPKGPGDAPKGKPDEDIRAAVLAAHRTVLADVCGRVVRMGVRALERAVKKAGNPTDAVLETMNAEHERRCAEMLLAPVCALRVSLGFPVRVDGVRDYITGLIGEHVGKLTAAASAPGGVAWSMFEYEAATELTERILSDAEKTHGEN